MNARVGSIFLLLQLACGRTIDLTGDSDAAAPAPGLDAATGGADAAIPDANIGDTWLDSRFSGVGFRIGCFGASFVKFVPAYEKWVGAQVCSPGRYKLFLAETRDGTFVELADLSGHGQDHCELINASFWISNEDDIRSGGCNNCNIGPNGSIEGRPAYVRTRYGQNFRLASFAAAGTRSADWIECGVEIP